MFVTYLFLLNNCIFGADTATSEKNVEENWGQIMNICDKAGKNCDDAKQYLKAIIKRLYHSDPHVGIKAVTVSIILS